MKVEQSRAQGKLLGYQKKESRHPSIVIDTRTRSGNSPIYEGAITYKLESAFHDYFKKESKKNQLVALLNTHLWNNADSIGATKVYTINSSLTSIHSRRTRYTGIQGGYNPRHDPSHTHRLILATTILASQAISPRTAKFDTSIDLSNIL